MANGGDDNVSILLNNGDGTFAAAVYYGAGNYTYSVFAADFDNDNDQDLAVANDGVDNISILFNNSLPDITVTPDSLSFGQVQVDQTSDQIVTVKNDGASNLVIGAITSLADPFSFQADTCSSQTLAPTEECTITVEFAPTSVASFTSGFDISSNDSDENPVTVTLSGEGIDGATPAPTPSDDTENYAGGELKVKDIELDKTYHNTKNNTDFYFYRKPTREFSVRKKLYIKMFRKSGYKKVFKKKKAFKTHYKLKLNVGKAKKATWPNVKKRMKYKVALRYTDAQLTKKQNIKEKNLRLFIKDRKNSWRGPYTVYQNRNTNTLKFKIRNYKLVTELASTNRTFSPTFYFRNLKKVRFVIATKKAFKKAYRSDMSDSYDFE